MKPIEARFAEMYDRHQRHVASYCARRMSPDRVDDAVSETFLTAWRRFEEMPRGDDALRWLYGVAYKVVGRQWRTISRGRRLGEKLESIGIDPVPIPEDVVVFNEESVQVLAALKRLSALDREILLLAAWEELEYREIADVLGIRSDAARQRFHKAKKRLTREFNRSEATSSAALPVEKGGVW